jgi:putative ABC transport system permease protein
MNEMTLALRKLARRPVFSLTTLFCLALGIGATTAIGSVINTLFFKSASVEDLDRVGFFMAMREGVEPFGVSPIEIEAYRTRSKSFGSLGIARTMDGNSVNLTGGERAERVRAAQASTAYFETLGTEPLMGRLFAVEEERSGGPGALLMSYGLWTRRFNAVPSIIGQVLRVNGESRTVVGILPERFDLPSKTELWLPLELDFERLPMDDLTSHSYMMVGRLADGFSLAQAETELVTIARDIAAEYPRSNTGWSVALIPFRDLLLGDVQGSMRTLIYALAGAVSLLLLIACVNGAHLFLARCLEQEREIALSAALGASRKDIFRQLFLEGLILAFGAGLLGSAVALAIVPAFMASSTIHEGAYTNFFRSIEVDGGVLALALAASLLTAFLFGTLPLLTVLGRDPGNALRSGGLRSSARSQAKLSRLLVVAEVAVSAMLLVGAGLLVRSLAQLARLDLGFRPESMVSVEFTLPASEFPRQSDRVGFSQRVLERVRSMPDVAAAGTTTDVPLRLGTWNSRYVILGTPPAEPGEMPWAAYREVSPGYLEALGVSLVRGRMFQAEDREGVEKVAIVSRELARRALGDADPLGRKIGHPDEIAEESGRRTIVGVVEDVKEDRYNFRIDRPVWYVPYEQAKESGILLNLVLRTRGGSADVGSEIRRVVRELYPEVAPGEVYELEPHVTAVVGAERTATSVALLLAVLGTALASLGLYGVMAYGVRQRFRELGLRMAVGASPKQLSRLVLGDGLRWVAFGLAAGFVGALLLALLLPRMFSNLLFETRPWDPFTYGVVAILFVAVTLAACYFPARRAGATNPVDALRME